MVDATRHESVFDPVKWGQKRVDVIGVGATGSKIALSLAKLGVKNLHVWDDDQVEAHNLANQVYGVGDVGHDKTSALAAIITAATGGSVTIHGRWTPEQARSAGEVVFCMVDSMSARQAIFDTYRLHPRVRLIVDSRMGAAHGQLLTYRPGQRDSTERYKASLFGDDEASVEVSACGTAITVGPTADIISGYAVWRFIQFAAGEEVEPEIAVMAHEPALYVL